MISNDAIREILAALDNDNILQNYIAQANARYVLLNTGVPRRQFPAYTVSDERLNTLALYYLSLGCSFAENENLAEAIAPLEKGASILEFIHTAENGRQPTSNYYGLIAAMAYYVSFQYSKAYIIVGKIEPSSSIAEMVRHFIARNFGRLNVSINQVLVDPTNTDGYISEDVQAGDGSTKVYTVVIARALDGFRQYLYNGNREVLAQAKQMLRDLKEIAEIEGDPGIWWVIRLLLLISDGFDEASLWNILPSYFDMEDPRVKDNISSLVYKAPRGIFELFLTQRKALNKVLNDNNGCVVSIPTSSGKTRIAEIAILHCKLHDAAHKVLYIAPFRALAFEVENSLEPVLGNASISVSHLYGGSLYSKLDASIIDESDVIIATPEKAKAILRANDGLAAGLKLVIIDEGHLLGNNRRLIANEMFYEELRFLMEENDGKFLLLSAVLPNSSELGEWLTGSTETVFKDSWRPSGERLGVLDWNGARVNLNWVSQDKDRQSYNNRFIVPHDIPPPTRRHKPRRFPGNKNEAVASTAFKLKSFGSVLIFVGAPKSVFVMAEAYFKCLGEEPSDHEWKHASEWRTFELAATETYGADSKWLVYARKGILCHHGQLHADVRLPMERLMTVDTPPVIIATSTLGQGVNLGVSSVIFSTLQQGQNKISTRDFWNIAGRAGRAFVDYEGKILVAHDTANKNEFELRRETRNIHQYFEKETINIAESGILAILKALKTTASDNDIDFDLLLELVAENRVVDLKETVPEFSDKFDLIDDSLLSLMLQNNSIGEIDLSWADDFFHKSLAYIQAREDEVITGEEVVSFLSARLKGIVEIVGNDRSKWRTIVQSSIPLLSDLELEKVMPEIIQHIEIYELVGDESIGAKIILLKQIEGEIKSLPILEEDSGYLASQELDNIRSSWIKAVPMAEILEITTAADIISKYFTYKLPWLLNGLAKKLRNQKQEYGADLIEELATLVEIGLPSLAHVKVYQAGVRSRAATDDIVTGLESKFSALTIAECKKELFDNKNTYDMFISEESAEWLDLLSRSGSNKHKKIQRIAPFVFKKSVHKKTTILYPCQDGKRNYLVSPDLSVRKDVTEGEIDFTEVCKVPGISFIYNSKEEHWQMAVSNPYVQVI